MDDIGVTHYCYRCYGENDRAEGVCVHCRAEIHAPPTISYAELLVRALRHPIAEVAMNAAATSEIAARDWGAKRCVSSR